MAFPEHQGGMVKLAGGVQEIRMKVTFEPGLERQVADCWFSDCNPQGKWMPLEQKPGSL